MWIGGAGWAPAGYSTDAKTVQTLTTGGKAGLWNYTGGNMMNGWYMGNMTGGGIQMVGDSLKEGESEEASEGAETEEENDESEDESKDESKDSSSSSSSSSSEDEDKALKVTSKWGANVDQMLIAALGNVDGQKLAS